MKIHYFYKRNYSQGFYDLEIVAWLEEKETSRQGIERLSFTRLERLRIFLSKSDQYHVHTMPICQLEGLPGVKKCKVDAYWINDTSDIEPTLELGFACTSAGDNGAINVWKDDAGMIQGELMRFCVKVEKKHFPIIWKWKIASANGLKELIHNSI